MKKLIALVLIQNFVIGQIQIPPEDGLDLFNNMMRYLFDNCGSEFGTIGFWGNDRIFLSNDQADFVVLNDSEVLLHPPTRTIKFLVMILDELNPNRPAIFLYKAIPTLAIETVFVFDKRGYNEDSMNKIFYWYQLYFENSKAYYCTETEGRLEVITINAFTNFTLPLWIKIKQYYFGSNDNYEHWTVLKTHYYKGAKFNYSSDVCRNLFFDRTKILNGYKMKGGVRVVNNFGKKFKVEKSIISKDTLKSPLVFLALGLQQTRLIKMLLNYLNITIIIITYQMPDNREADVSNKLSSRFCDLCFTPISPIEHEDNPDFYAYFRMSYPINFLYDVIVTHNRGLESPLEKMFEFYGWLTIIATTAIIWITFTVIYLSNSQNSSKLSFAVFECLRILLSNSIYTRMNTAKIRIFFSVIFLYFLIIQATFSGHLAAFLTKPVYKKNVETLEDLKDPRYTKIYARKGTESYFDDPVLFNKTQFDINADCVKYISDKSVACVDYKNYLEYLIPDHNLYTPKKNLMSIYSLLMMRGNWPLKDRVNNLVMSLHHSGIKDLWDRMDRRNLNKVLRKFQDNAENYNRPIEIGDVMFAFDLLGVGLFFAIICFIVECIIKKFPKITTQSLKRSKR